MGGATYSQPEDRPVVPSSTGIRGTTEAAAHRPLPQIASLPALQRAAGNHAVSQLFAPPSVQRQGRPHSQAANIARINTLRTNADRRVTLATDYQTTCLQVGDGTRDKLSMISATYTEAYNTFRGVLNRAQQEAQNQQRWTDIIVGVACGTAAGLAAAFVLPSTAAGWLSLTLAEAGTAAASSATQGVVSAGLSAVASKTLTVPGQVISSAGLEPAIQQVAMWQKVAGIYRSGLEVAPLAQASHRATMALSDLLTEVRVLESGGTTTLTEARLASTLTQLEQQDSQLTTATTELTNKISELTALKAAIDAINPQAKTARQVEKDIWVLWMAGLPKDSNILDLDAIEDHIGPKGLRIVDFGIYTSDADENEAIDQARTDAMFLEAAANNRDVPPGQVIGGPHTR